MSILRNQWMGWLLAFPLVAYDRTSCKGPGAAKRCSCPWELRIDSQPGPRRGAGRGGAHPNPASLEIAWRHHRPSSAENDKPASRPDISLTIQLLLPAMEARLRRPPKERSVSRSDRPLMSFVDAGIRLLKDSFFKVRVGSLEMCWRMKSLICCWDREPTQAAASCRQSGAQPSYCT